MVKFNPVNLVTVVAIWYHLVLVFLGTNRLFVMDIVLDVE
jgi:hypothetical protein